MAGNRKPGRLAGLDMSRGISGDSYDRKLAKLQTELARIQQAYLFSGDSAVLVFEGWDAAGKGGVIRRISAALDPRGFKVWPIGAPPPHDRQRHFLARFMERLPQNGAIAAFDRSWYGRVLVERVEGLTPPDRWQAGYREINDFERMLRDDGTRVLKFFLHITEDEQLRRFEERLRNPLKLWKLSYEDFRNRRRWDDYALAIEEMLERTSVPGARWHVVPGNNKKRARIDIISTVVRTLSKGVDLSPPRIDERTLEAARDELQIPPELARQLDSGRIR